MRSFGTEIRKLASGGLSIVEVAVSLGLVGLSFKGLMIAADTASTWQKYAARELDQVAIRQFYRDAISCGKTYEAIAAAGNPQTLCGAASTTTITLQTATGTPIANTSGSYNVHARCIEERLKVDIAPRGTNKWKDLFGDIPFSCIDERWRFAASSSSPYRLVVLSDESKDGLPKLQGDCVRGEVRDCTRKNVGFRLSGLTGGERVTVTVKHFKGGTYTQDFDGDPTVSGLGLVVPAGYFTFPMTDLATNGVLTSLIRPFPGDTGRCDDANMFCKPFDSQAVASVLISLPNSQQYQCTADFTVMTPIVLAWSHDLERAHDQILKDAILAPRTPLVASTNGWLRAGTGKIQHGYLVYDENLDGQVDLNRELFGDDAALTRFGQKLNGYEMMAKFDDNGDALLTPEDAVFRKLRLWSDYDGNRRVDFYELRDITDLGVSSIEVKYRRFAPEPASIAIQLASAPYYARFHGPDACGLSGCASFDVYFLRLQGAH